MAGPAIIPRYRIDLDKPPSERWQEVIRDFREKILQTEQTIEAIIQESAGWIGGALETIASSVLSGVTKVGKVYYGEELKGISKESGLKLGKLTAMQLVYEAVACCTSIVVPDEQGRPIHIRTMDWDMDFLGDMTVDVQVCRGSTVLFHGTTWAGYVGMLTGVRPGGYSCSVNFRVADGTYWSNLKRAIGGSWPSGFLLREVLESTPDYAQASTYLRNSELIAPTYFTIAGMNVNEGVILARDPKSVHIETPMSQRGFLVQSNIDQECFDQDYDILYSIQRRRIASDYLQSIAAVTSADQLWSLMGRRPILNDLTVSATYMQPYDGYLETRLPRCWTRADAFRHPGARSTPMTDRTVVMRDAQGAQGGGGDRAGAGDGHGDVGQESSEYPTLSKTPSDGSKELSGNPSAGTGGAHTGTWHSAYGQCSVKCAFKLGVRKKIGMCHWSCCYAVDQNGPCTQQE
eukprot:GFYU01016682.1.p1 GENE.GFYU01016682.1~~GFYU01016682.1.p1  ORF type:complete len:469 (-),score=72.64 GFYU01016682.1:29-1411(-)